MNKRVLLICLGLLCLGFVIGGTVKYLTVPKYEERIVVDIRKTGDEKIIAVLLVRAVSTDVQRKEIIARANEEAKKLGGEAKIEQEVIGQRPFARFVVLKKEDI